MGAEHLGFAYVKAFAEMMGIHDCEAYTLEGMDIDPSKRKICWNMRLLHYKFHGD